MTEKFLTDQSSLSTAASRGATQESVSTSPSQRATTLESLSISPSQGETQESKDEDEDDDPYSGVPPAYAAYKVASILLPHGPTMFGDKSSANCILWTGTLKHYVHVPMLVSRSATFRSIFDDMLAKEAWGPIDDEDDDDDESDMEIDENQAEGSDHHSQSGSVHQEMEKSDSELEDWEEVEKVEENEDEDMDVYEDEDDEDDEMPVLSIDLADPEGSCFGELLRWVIDDDDDYGGTVIYTDDGKEWVKCFTPQNYHSILENICFLNINTPEVLEICKTFEQTDPSSQGKAEAMFARFQEQQLSRQRQLQQEQKQ
ncbi:hypothetical protein BGZ49_006690 [Haplosporangium sp. Z 27]|nr:hypothetical protein BGZ49_006690 [Haplosporangium sp. Z 27]